jgi:dimethylamine monooxygenase subunit A
VIDLPDPPFYFPLRHGRYEVAPGLNRFGKELGGGVADQKLFQFDRTFPHFRAEKFAARSERLDKYFCTADISPATMMDVSVFIIQRLLAEHPALFRETPGGLYCAVTNETLDIGHGHTPRALDALACQVQEDLAIVSTSLDRGHWLSAAHVCFPNGWAPGEKVGHSFATVHGPVAGMADMNRRGEEFVNIMIRATDGLVRFAWGVTFDDRLNHHPDKPRTPFDPSKPRAFLRVERQTIRGFPARGAALFTIRTYLYDLHELRRYPATRDPLLAALISMSPESRAYKGIADHFDPLMQWLSQSLK